MLSEASEGGRQGPFYTPCELCSPFREPGPADHLSRVLRPRLQIQPGHASTVFRCLAAHSPSAPSTSRITRSCQAS